MKTVFGDARQPVNRHGSIELVSNNHKSYSRRRRRWSQRRRQARAQAAAAVPSRSGWTTVRRPSYGFKNLPKPRPPQPLKFGNAPIPRSLLFLAKVQGYQGHLLCPTIS